MLTSENDSQLGELGLQMLQRRVKEFFFAVLFIRILFFSSFFCSKEADILFGDNVVSYEKMQEVEFSFFTLPDSGAFLTHAPRRLSEAFALLYPFRKEVWPPLIFTIVIVGPILYLLIIVPKRMKRRWRRKRKHLKPFYDIIYIKEMRGRRRINFLEDNTRCSLIKDGLLSRCVWFTCHIFLRQCSYSRHGI